jgi:2-phosphoglycerate kinase
MIYLIGGSPRCGKTTVAERLAKKANIPWFPADYLGAVIFQYLSEEEQNKKFPISRIRDEKPGTDHLYEKHSPAEVVDFYRTQAEAIWPGLRAFIKYAAHDEQAFILEGYQIWPDLLTELPEEIKKSIKPIFLYKTNLQEIEAGFKKNTGAGDWLLEKTKDEKTFEKVASMVALYGERTVEDAHKHNMPVVDMDENFEDKIQSVIAALMSETVSE